MNEIRKSVRVLKSLQMNNGGIRATPREGAYPYVYTRDAVIISKAFNKVGLTKNSEKFYRFMKKYANVGRNKEIFQRYNYNGLPCVTRKHENDNEGLLLYGIYDTYLHNKDVEFIEDMWVLIEGTCNLILSYIKNGLVKTDVSIHEFYRLEHGYEIWSNCACCRGLYDASKMAELLNRKKEAKLWKEKADLILKNIKKKMFNKNLRVYIKNIRYKNVPDIAMLAPFYFELDNSRANLRKSMNFLEKYIWDTNIGGFRRFRKFEICNDWHWYTGGSGSWVFLTLWCERFYKKLGDEKMYRKCKNWVNSVMKKSGGLLPEHVALKEDYDEWKNNEIEFNSRIINETKKSEKRVYKFKNREVVYWAIPLGWSHAEYILTRK